MAEPLTGEDLASFRQRFTPLSTASTPMPAGDERERRDDAGYGKSPSIQITRRSPFIMSSLCAQ
jgi:hypothetical protein